MKKILLLSSLLTVCSLALVSTMTTSDANASLPNDGNAGAPMDNGGQDCGSGYCHAVASTATTNVIFSDIPSSGYVGGTTYNFTVTMSGAAAYGFELTPQTALSSTGLGTWIAGAGSSVSTKYIKHTTKKTGASAVWTFQWIAPTTAPTVTFYGAFNYANNNMTKTGDIIKTSSVTYTANSSTSVNEINKVSLLSVFPNPTTDLLYITSDEIFRQGHIYSLDGKLVKTISEQELNSKSVFVSNLNSGIYFIHMQSDHQTLVTKFTKND
jgi:hypothetical protein